MRPERLKRPPRLPISRRMTFVDRLMPELASSGRRTRVAGHLAAAAMLAALAGEGALTTAGAASRTVAYAVVMAGRPRSLVDPPRVRGAAPPAPPPRRGAPPPAPRAGRGRAG